ncbi:MAG TPA: fructokinase, partial [Erythrobacter sp.]|nr:fructokinase [Erythrobacter sp.]
ESAFGAGRELASLAYVTVGTGIGGGLVVDGRALHGAAHPEMGHLFPRRHPEDGEFEGICPAHGDCLEGLACGPAILQRWGARCPT